MKRLLYILLLIPTLLSAQTYNAFVADIQGGFAGKQVGADAAVHVGYGLRHGHFLFRISAGGGYNYLSTPMPNTSEELPAIDSEMFHYTQLCDYTNRIDRSHLVELQAPVLFGAEWSQFYFLLGATLGCRIYGQSRIQAQVTTAGDYDMFYDPFVDMPNHGYTTVPYLSAPIATPTAWNLYASAEIGVPFGEHLRLGAFAEYPILNTKAPAPYRVGLRLTVWVGREHKRTYPCKCMNDNHIRYNHYDDF